MKPHFPFLHERPDGILIDVLLAPRSSRNSIVGIHDGRLKIAVHAPPVESAANQALGELLADIFSVSKSAISITQGQTSKRKTVAVFQLSVGQATAALEKILTGG